MAYAALVSLAQTITQILNHDHNPTTLPVYQQIIKSISCYAVVLQSFLENSPENPNILEARIRDVANTAEDAIELLLSETNPSNCSIGASNSAKIELQLKEVAEKLKSIAGDEVVRKRNDASVVSNISSLPASKEIMLGSHEDLFWIMNHLASSSPSRLQILPIVGIGGIGKTTLAKLVYNSSPIIEHFDIRGWVTVSQDYNVIDIALDLLASIRGSLVERGVEIEIDIPMECLIRECLINRRYLVVMDDIWSNKAWDDVRNLFPDNDNGSRIILTTRLHDVAAYAAPSSPLHVVRLLSENDSWSLLRLKVFGDQICPPELERAGREIAARCRGLPLSIVVMSGLLSKIDRASHVWKPISESDEQLETVISLSYAHLPHHLKACFLYMAGFPEDYEVRVSELVKLWVAEGFVKCSNGSKSLEEEAGDCLDDLVQRGLVSVTSRNFVREFCIRRGRQDKLLLPVVDYLPCPILRRHFLPLVMRNHRRVSATWCDLDLKDSMHCSRARSIICIPRIGCRRLGSVKSFNLLRVFHVLRRNGYRDWEQYSCGDLEAEAIKASYRLPVSSFTPSQRGGFSSRKLANTSLVTDFVCSERIAEMIPKIQKLRICYSEEKFGESYHLGNLVHLLRLEKLKLETRSSFEINLNHVFPMSLKKLTLSGWRLPWSDTKIVGLLPNLQVLKLRNYACDGEQWETSWGGFCGLRLLLIDESNLVHWKARSSHFPRLKCLVLHRCPNLSEIPIAFRTIRTLELIEVDDHNQSLFDSAKKIEARWDGKVQVRVKCF